MIKLMAYRSQVLLVASLALAAAAPQLACSGDHDRLAKTDASSATVGGGMGGDSATTTTTATGAGGSGGIVEPPGPTKVTLVNGVVDAPAVRVCALPLGQGSQGELPFPDTDGLPFARPMVLDPIADFIPDGDVELVVVAGNLPNTGGMTCDDLMTNPPAGTFVRSVGQVPQSVLVQERSLLLVLSGCVGGPGKSHEFAELVCGLGYSEDFGNAILTAGSMSRIATLDRVPLQFVQASFGLDPSILSVRPGTGAATAQVLIEQWSYGAVSPFPPFTGFSQGTLGDVATSEIDLRGLQASMVAHDAPFGVAINNSDLTVADFIDGTNFVFIGVGASPLVGSGSWWHPYTYTVVKANPD